MSTAGVFSLITNNSLQDELIMKSNFLIQRINEASKENLRTAQGLCKNYTDEQLARMATPTLDFVARTHAVFVQSVFRPFVSIAHEYVKILPQGISPKMGDIVTFSMITKGDFINDCVVHIRLDGFSAVDTANKVKYIDMPGHRLLKEVRFKTAETILDSYDVERYNVHYNFKLDPKKEAGYLRCIGQEVPRVGFVTATPSYDEVREYKLFGDGAQTFKQRQPALDLWIPLMFWFKDINVSLPNFCIPKGQTNIELQLSDASDLVAYAIYGSNTPPIYNTPQITSCELYTNHIYIMKEVANIVFTNFKIQLIRCTRVFRKTNIVNPQDRILLNTIKYPVESLYFGFRPQANQNIAQRWYRNAIITLGEQSQMVAEYDPGTQSYNPGVSFATFFTEDNVIDKITLDAAGIQLTPELPPIFMNSYTPYQQGPAIKTPYDAGWYMVNFNHKPGEYQPSGYFNFSNEREVYINYTSAKDANGVNYIRPENPVDFILIADCINFLVIDKNGKVSTKFVL